MSAQKDPRFARFRQRDDVAEIRECCTRDSIEFSDPPSWTSAYSDSWPARIAPPVVRAGPRPDHVDLSDGADAAGTTYASHFRPFRRDDVPPLALPPADSGVIAGDPDLPTPRVSTTHDSLLAAAGRRAYDPQSARVTAAAQRASHFDLGSVCATTARASYAGRVPPPPAPIVRGSSITFDGAAGLGPRARGLSKRRRAPAVRDAEPIEQRAKHFDIGADPPTAESTTRSTFRRVCGPVPQRVAAPPAAALADDGADAPPWGTSYGEHYQARARIDNAVDADELRTVHWEAGFAPREWPVRETAQVAERVEPAPDLHTSNEVFRGDGEMEFETTARAAAAGRADEGRRTEICLEAQRDSLILGSDPAGTTTTAADANKLAGTGRRAERCLDMSKIRPAPMAQGGYWDRFAGCDPEDDRDARPVDQLRAVDGRWQRDAHWQLNATQENPKPAYRTTYFETICEPRLQPDGT
jgi:hypothetical protein